MIIQANALQIPLADKSVQCVVTSPPYWGLKDYGEPGQIGLETTPELYVESLLKIFREVRRILKDDGTIWLNLGDCYATGAGKVGNCPGAGEQGARWLGDVDRIRDQKRGYRGGRTTEGMAMGPVTQPNRMPIVGLKPKDLVGIPWRIAFALQADGWYLRSEIIWSKPNPMPESVEDRPTRAHESIFFLAKNERYYFDQEAVAEPQVKDERTRRLLEQERGLKTRYAFKRLSYDYGQHHPGQNGVARSVEARHRLADKGTRNIRSVWHVSTNPFPEAHFATFPEELIKPCILAGCPMGGVVCDPFVGSGTTCKVAEDLGRIGVGIDLKFDYALMAKRRAAQIGFGRLLSKCPR